MSQPIVTLRCQTVIDGVMAYVNMPLAVEEWEYAGTTFREMLRAKVREELRASVAARIGEGNTDDRYDRLPVWEDFHDRCTVECVGGPLDGTRMNLSTAEPPLSLQLPLPARTEDLMAPAHELSPTTTYGPIRDDHGFLARATDGAWRLGWQR
jgi:hypothetical protein